MVAFEQHVGAHPKKFGHVHEAVLENGFGDVRLAFGLRHHRQELSLHVGGKAGILLGGEVDGTELAFGSDLDAVFARE